MRATTERPCAPDNGYSRKEFLVVGKYDTGFTARLTVFATCRWSAILEGRRKGIVETLSCDKI